MTDSALSKTKVAAKKAVAKKAPAKKAVAAKSTVKKVVAKKAPAKKAVAAKPTVKEVTPKKVATKKVDGDQLVSFYRDMMLIRRFEERAARAYTEALIGGYCHLNLGEEATVVGLMSALRETDYLFTNYREHGYAIMRGIDPNRAMAELYGRVDGVSKGWGGSMHMFDMTHRLLGGYGIVGGQLPLATGAALAIQYRGLDEVVMCTMGDGTANIGAFHESLNIAALWNLPVVFVVINNGLGMGTTVAKASAEPEIYKRASAYAMTAERVDGLDPMSVLHAAQRAIASARTGKPYLLEVVCERLRGHSVVDPAKYRSPEDVAQLAKADPVPNLAARLIRDKILTAAEVHQIDEEQTARADAADAFAQASAQPDVSTLFDYNYATPVANDSRRLPGDPLFAVVARPEVSR
ncbi:MAG: pyruvate dehydrogenase (acetyl-transferring) E1 component subunit alpha [Acidimicrobiaceae bacterium]|nr:pyruvate dehydrogenase (acetyl-transferring) E1 component subunit alpha [Acidimicrobiaceae bacterium]